MLFNLDTLNSYPQDLQDAMKEAGKRTEKYCQEVVSPDTKTKTYDDIAAAGVEINEVTEEQYQVFADQVSDYCYEKLRVDVGSELWDKCINWLRNIDPDNGACEKIKKGASHRYCFVRLPC